MGAYVPRLLVEWARERPSVRWEEVEGTLAFVDVSGFTRLTERLARKGKAGAEEMTDLLDNVFGELVGAAADSGGDVLKWAGDAVLLLFTGEEHLARACACAFVLQRTMRTVGRLRTSAGTVRLRMSVGIHTDVFQFFLLGTLHRELVLAGPGATATALAEGAAEAGEVAVSEATAARLEPRLLGDHRLGGVALRRPPRTTAIAVGDRGPEPPDLVRYLPLGVREHVLADRHDAEHRSVAIAFVEFCRTDELLEREGAEALGRALDESITAVQEAARQHGVTFLETDIGHGAVRVLLVAGAPTSAANEEERMLRTMRAVADAGLPLPVRIGVNAGRVFTGDFGPSDRRTYSIKGDPVNLAARLMTKAAEGQILATTPVVERSRTTFATIPLEPFTVKGKARPVQAVDVRVATGTRSSGAGRPPFVGRERELATLLEALSSARDWEGRIVELVGEAGIGKSRLVEEVEASAVGVETFRTACEEYERSTPYFAFRPLLRHIFGIDDVVDPTEAGRRLGELVAQIAPHLAPWLPLVAIPVQAEVESTPEVDSLDERFRPAQFAETLRELLGLSLPRPTILVFDDVHWMDDASSELLAGLAESLALRPWLILATRRPVGGGFVPPGHVEAIRVELEPLGAGDSDALIQRLTDELPLAPHHATAVVERAGGNPLFLAELVRAASADGGLETLPDSVEGLLTAQVDRLAPGDRSVLRYASVLGASFQLDLLDAALAADARVDDEVWRRLDAFLSREDGTARFRHALVREAAYEALPYRRRREVHARVAEAIEHLAAGRADESAEILSLHFFHAQRFDEAWRYSRIAAERASSLYANVDAAAFYERALAAATSLESVNRGDVAAVWEALGDVRVRLSEFERAGDAFRQARQALGGDPVAAARFILKQALVPWRLGRYDTALRWIRRGLRALDGLAGREAMGQRARLYVWHGIVLYKQGRAHDAIEWCQRAIEEADRAGAQDALAHAYDVLDSAYLALGRFEDAVYSTKALAIYEELGNVERQAAALNNIGAIAHFQGRWDEALAFYDRARERWQKIGDRWSASFPIQNRGLILSDQGHLDEAEQLFRDALRVARASRSLARAADALADLGRLKARAGEFGEALSLLAQARSEYERDGQRTAVLGAEAKIAETLVLEGRAEEALVLATSTLKQVEARGGVYNLVPMLERVRGSAFAQRGRLDEARVALERSVREARQKHAQADEAFALAALAEVARSLGEPAEALDDEAAAIFRRLGIVAPPTAPVAAR